MPAPLTAEAFAGQAEVSRETLARLILYVDVLRKWTARINLVSRASLADVWRRHILDSAQLLPLGADHGSWLDLGSGAGLPGLIIAIMGVSDVHLVESDSRKCAFLREAARITETTVTIHNRRIEDLTPLPAATISARALADLPTLLTLAAPHITTDTVLLLPKGQDVADELTAAAKCWIMSAEQIPSRSDDSGIVLRLKEVSHVSRWSEG